MREFVQAKSQSDLQSDLMRDALSVSLDSLRPSIRDYAHNLRCQIQQIFENHHVSDYASFKSLALSQPKTIPSETLSHLHTLLRKLHTVLKTQELPFSEHHFIIHDANNPYHQALSEAGLTSLETQDIKINLPELLESDRALYTSQGLPEWAEALTNALDHLTPQTRHLLESEIKDGAIPIFLPEASIQRKTLKKTLETLKPLWIKEGQEKTLDTTYLWGHLTDLIDNNHPSLTENLPDHPYLLLVKPTQAPDPQTCTKTLEQQQELLKELQQTNDHLFSILPQEYAALQAVFTYRLQQQIADCSGPIADVNTLNPLDHDTLTRFITLPLPSVGGVPSGYFDPGNRQPGFDRGGSGGRNAGRGFRPAVRVF